MAREKTNRIVVYRLNSLHKFEKLDFSAKGYATEYADETIKLFVQTGKCSTPQWIAYIAPLLSTDPAKIVNESCSFILFVKHAGNLYALAGGYGYTQLEEHVDDEFGLQVALRLINGEAISAISQRAMKGTTRQVFRAVAGYQPVFDRDNYNRILKALEGRGRFEGRTFRVSGRSSLVLRTGKSVHNLESVLSEVEDILGREPQIHFPKSYEEVKGKDLFRELDEARFERFRAFWAGDSNRETLYLEFDDPIV